MLNTAQIVSSFDPATGTIPGTVAVERRLGDLRGCFADANAFEQALAAGNPLIYSVAAVEPARGDGDLHYGIGLIMPGRIGEEFFMTKGHFHSWRDAAEIYIGLTGEGAMLLQDEATGESRMTPLLPNQAVYVPGKTAHRTVNIGNAPLTYLGIYPAKAGHDYAVIAKSNFRCVILQRGGQPVLIERTAL